jgi:gamma-glutamyltranspeptidase/glutathione hydrolase
LNCFGFELFTPPPPSGGLTSLTIVQTLEQLNLRQFDAWGGEYFHLLGETTKACWHERRQLLGDPDFVNVPIDELLSPAAAEARVKDVRFGRTVPSGGVANQSPHTSNVIAADGEGNVISLTATQGWMYGSHLVVDGLGLVLNHGMSRFDYVPGHPNAPAAGKRMQHNMSPLVALKGGRPAFVVGMPGGPKIVNVTAQLMIDLMAFGATPAEAIAAPRLHTEGDEPLVVSTHMPDVVVAELERLGHGVRREEDMGGPVNVLAIDPQIGVIDVASGEGTGAVSGW